MPLVLSIVRKAMRKKAKLQEIEKLCAEQELIKQDIISATIMDDEGMGATENVLYKMEERLRQIDLELKKLIKPSFFKRLFSFS